MFNFNEGSNAKVNRKKANVELQQESKDEKNINNAYADFVIGLLAGDGVVFSGKKRAGEY
jgi:hypothetical protein